MIPSDIDVPGYEVEEVIGSGGFGTVVRARDLRFNRDVAIKIGHQAITDPNVARRFDRECRALGSVSGHSHIVSVSGAGQLDDGRPWLAMEYHDGGSLADRVQRDGPLPWPEVRNIGIALTKALQAAHDVGVLHRDLKPENILMSKWGEPVLVDFGIARLADEAPTVTTSVTASIAYAPPEVLSGAPPDAVSDIYSLAATLAGLMLGHSPFDTGVDSTMAARIARVITGPPPDLTGVAIPPEGEELLVRAMAHDPAARPATMDDFRAALEATPDVAPERPTPVDPASGTVLIRGETGLASTSAPLPPPAPSSAPTTPPPPAAPSAPTTPPPSAASAPPAAAPVPPAPPTPPAAPPSPPPSGGSPGSSGSKTGWIVAAVAVGVLAVGGVIAVVVAMAGKGSSGPGIEIGGDTTSSTTTTTSSIPDGPEAVDLASVVIQPDEVPDDYVPATVDLVGSDRPTICNLYPISDAILDEAGSEYSDPVFGSSLASEVIEFTDDASAAEWMTLFEGLPDQCVTWDFVNDDGSVSTWDSQLRDAGTPYNATERSIVARTDNDYGCIVNAYAVGYYVVRTTLCGTAPLDDAMLDTLSNLVGDSLP